MKVQMTTPKPRRERSQGTLAFAFIVESLTRERVCDFVEIQRNVGAHFPIVGRRQHEGRDEEPHVQRPLVEEIHPGVSVSAVTRTQEENSRLSRVWIFVK